MEMRNCLKRINDLGENSSTDYVWVIGSSVHIYRRKNQVYTTVQEINNFLDSATERTIFGIKYAKFVFL